jgi:hypothetical protein
MQVTALVFAVLLPHRLMPLVLDHLEEGGPAARIMLSGAGLGGSLAGLLLMMFVARGMRPSAFAPVHTLNAPAVLCEVPDFKQWCSKDGCSLQVSSALEVIAVAACCTPSRW